MSLDTNFLRDFWAHRTPETTIRRSTPSIIRAQVLETADALDATREENTRLRGILEEVIREPRGSNWFTLGNRIRGALGASALQASGVDDE